MKAVFNNKNINIAGYDYFVYNSLEVVFGGYGEKLSRIGAMNGLNQVGVIPSPKLAEVKLVVATLEVEFAASAGGNLLAGVKVPKLGGGEISLTAGALRNGDVKLVKVAPAGDNELIRQINASPAVLKQLIEIGNDARVVESVLCAIQAELHSKFTAGLSSKGAVIVDGVMVKAERAAEYQKETTVKVGAGNCLGYSLGKPKWDAVQDKNKTKLVGLDPDEHGFEV
jgi:hypothetical protein